MASTTSYNDRKRTAWASCPEKAKKRELYRKTSFSSTKTRTLPSLKTKETANDDGYNGKGGKCRFSSQLQYIAGPNNPRLSKYNILIKLHTKPQKSPQNPSIVNCQSACTQARTWTADSTKGRNPYPSDSFRGAKTMRRGWLMIDGCEVRRRLKEKKSCRSERLQHLSGPKNFEVHHHNLPMDHRPTSTTSARTLLCSGEQYTHN